MPPDTPLVDAVRDSLAKTEFVRELGEQLGFPLQATLLFDCPAVGSLASHLAGPSGPLR